MNSKILSQAYNEILEDTKFIRLSTFTTIFHSLIFVIYIITQFYLFISKISGKSIEIENIQQFFKYFVYNENSFIFFLIIGIILTIGYVFLPPIAEASLIYYLEDKKKSMANNFGKGLLKFFPMFEFHSIFVSLFNFLVYFIILGRLIVLEIINNPVIVTIMIFRAVIIIFVSVISPYTKFYITLENCNIWIALLNSIQLSLQNFKITLKFVFFTYILYLRFAVNILIIIGLPVFMIYIIQYYNIKHNIYLEICLYVFFIISIIFTSYVNGIIDAFFLNYWYKVFKKIYKKNQIGNMNNISN